MGINTGINILYKFSSKCNWNDFTRHIFDDKSELDWFYKDGGASLFWPEKWKEFVETIPKNEQSNIIKAYHKRLFHKSKEIRKVFNFMVKWENSLASMQKSINNYTPPINYALAFSRIENHYFINKGFLESDNYILSNVKI